jgi:F1F0 ATPase subunit 2
MTQLLMGLLAGVALGAVYFGGLWWTVREVTETGGPLKLVASFVVRAAVVLVGFYLMLQAGLLALGAAMLAFIGVRMLSTRKLGPQAVGPQDPKTPVSSRWS